MKTKTFTIVDYLVKRFTDMLDDLDITYNIRKAGDFTLIHCTGSDRKLIELEYHWSAIKQNEEEVTVSISRIPSSVNLHNVLIKHNF